MKFYDKIPTTKGFQHRMHLRFAYQHAERFSDDESTKVGVGVTENPMCEAGVLFANQFIRGTPNTPQNQERPLKYCLIEHAERSAIYHFAKNGKATKDTIMYTPWFPCPDCARGIIKSGITKIIGHLQAIEKTPERWLENFDISFDMLERANINLQQFDGRIYGTTNLFNGEIWHP